MHYCKVVSLVVKPNITMWTSFLLLSLALTPMISSSNFGFESHMPNLLRAHDASDMGYLPYEESDDRVKNGPYNVWYKKWDGLQFEVSTKKSICFDRSSRRCIVTKNRHEDLDRQTSGDVGLVYRADLEEFEFNYAYMFNIFIRVLSPTVGMSSEFLDQINIGAHVRKVNDWRDQIYKYSHGNKKFPADRSWIVYSFVLKFSNADINKINSKGLEVVDFIIKVQPGMNFVADAASLDKISYPNALPDADDFIAAKRMGIVKLLNKRKEDVTVKVKNTKLYFPFGVAVNAKKVGDNHWNKQESQDYRAYLEARKPWWTWGVHYYEAKWQAMEPNEPEGVDQYKIVNDALDWADQHGISYRGHCMHWNSRNDTPSWVDALDGAEFLNVIKSRTTGVATNFNRFKHWDIINEYVIDHYYDMKMGINNVEMYLMDQVKSINKKIQRFTNQYDVLLKPTATMEFLSSNLKLWNKKKIEGIGIQAHLKGDDFDIELIKRRLMMFTGIGPVWITELTIEEPDELKRADMLRDVLTLFYGTEGVDGVIMWDFAPDPPPGPVEWLRNTALAYPNLQNTAAGDMVDDLMGEQWFTDEDVIVPASSTVYLPVYHGDVKVMLGDQMIGSERLLSPRRNLLKYKIR